MGARVGHWVHSDVIEGDRRTPVRWYQLERGVHVGVTAGDLSGTSTDTGDRSVSGQAPRRSRPRFRRSGGCPLVVAARVPL